LLVSMRTALDAYTLVAASKSSPTPRSPELASTVGSRASALRSCSWHRRGNTATPRRRPPKNGSMRVERTAGLKNRVLLPHTTSGGAPEKASLVRNNIESVASVAGSQKAPPALRERRHSGGAWSASILLLPMDHLPTPPHGQSFELNPAARRAP
jgi:hypothetical protein